MLLRFLILLLLLGLPGVVKAIDLGPAAKSDQPIHLEADQLSYDKDSGIYRATGDVKLTQGQLEVQGQKLQWNQPANEIEVEGDVHLISPEDELFGSRARYNICTETGVVENSHFYLYEQNLHVFGESIEKLGDVDYRVKKGTFTTCDGTVPAWKFGASQLDVTLGGYARARNMIFYVKDIPLLYLPYMIYPVRTERESGFLLPAVGYSDKRGYQFSGAYYQVLGVNQDATLYLDYLSEMGIGEGLEYRYIFGNSNAGEARVYHIDVDKVDGETVDEDRYALEWKHDGMLPGGVRMVVDAEYVNEREFFKDFGDVAGEYNKDKVESTFSLNKSWGKYSLVGLLDYTKDLESDDKTTLQKLPQITFGAARQRIGESVFYYALDTEYVNFTRREGLEGERFSVRPALSASISLLDAIDIAPKVSYIERVYWNLSDGSDSENKGIAQFETKINTRLQKVYTRPFGFFGKLRHTIEPELTYRYTPDIDQEYLPDFDRYDRIEHENQIEYALVQRLTLRTDSFSGKPNYRELLYLRLSQAYDLTDAAREQRFQDLRIEMTMLPTTWSSLKTDTTLDVDSGDWTKVSIAAGIHDRQGNTFSAEYRYNPEDDIDYLTANVNISFFKPVYLNYMQRYDLSTNERLEHVIGIGYVHQCWAAGLTYTDREDDRSIMLTLSMRGIGSVFGDSGKLGGF